MYYILNFSLSSTPIYSQMYNSLGEESLVSEAKAAKNYKRFQLQRMASIFQHFT